MTKTPLTVDYIAEVLHNSGAKTRTRLCGLFAIQLSKLGCSRRQIRAMLNEAMHQSYLKQQQRKAEKDAELEAERQARKAKLEKLIHEHSTRDTESGKS